MSNSERQEAKQGKGSPVNFLMLVLVIFMIPLAVVITLAANPALPIVNQVYGCSMRILSTPGVQGYVGQNCFTGSNLVSGTDAGSVLNQAMTFCPQGKNPQSGRTVPTNCNILITAQILNGTTPVKVFDDWGVSFTSMVPTCLTMQNPNTANIGCPLIDIESTHGVIECLQNGAVADGGGVLSFSGLTLRTKTNVTSPDGGGSFGGVFQCGTGVNNVAYSQLYLNNMGCKSDAIATPCFDIETTGADDFTQQSGVLFASCFTFHVCVTGNAWDYNGIGTIQTSTTAVTTNVQADSYAVKFVAQGSFHQRSLSMAGTYNGVLEVAGNPGQTTCGNVVGCVAGFDFINFGTSVPLNTYPVPSTGSRVFLNAPVSIFQYTTSGGNNNDMFSNSTSLPDIRYNLNIQHSSTAKNYQFIPNCFSNFATNGGNGNFAFGAYYTMGSGGIATPVSGRPYTLLGTRLGNLTISGGTNVLINIKDPNGYSYNTNAVTLTNDSPQIGATMTVSYSVAPTVKCYLEPVI